MLFFASAVIALVARLFTFYTPGLGACGLFHSESEYVAAISRLTFDTYPGATPNPNLNPICGRNLKATVGGKSVVVKIVDRCAGCAGAYDVDMSPTAFGVLAAHAEGRLRGVQWDWTDSAPGPAVLEEIDGLNLGLLKVA